MIYIAAPDNSLIQPALSLPDELQRIGSSDRVHLLLQIDTSALPASRFFVNVAGALPRLVSDPIPAIQNTGSVEAFIDFVSFAKKNHEAKHYVVVLNGHALGVEDFPGNEGETAEVSPMGNASAAGNLPSATGSLLIDKNPADGLTNRELKEAIDRAREILAVDRIDIVGFDACLMSMIEIAMQIRESTALMVGSEQTIPSKGWPYSAIIPHLIANPGIEPRQLASLMVDEYLKFYDSSPDKEQIAAEIVQRVNNDSTVDLQEQIVGALESFQEGLIQEQVTMSVCDLSRAEPLSQEIRRLVPLLEQCLAISEMRLAVLKARFDSLSFFISDFVDLFNFCGHLAQTLEETPFATACVANETLCNQVKTSCQTIMGLIHKDDETGFVSKSGVTFPDDSGIKDARGLSIYFPLILPLYHELVFSKETLWDGFLSKYMTSLFLQAGGNVDQAGENLSNLPMGGNGSKPKGAIKTMSRNSATAPARIPCLVLSQGAIITDKASGNKKVIAGLSVLDMTPKPLVHVPADTAINRPGKLSVKAITGTELKASSGTELKAASGGGGVKPVLEMVVPACTLRELTTGNQPTNFSDGTSIVAAENAPIVVMKDVTVTAPLP